MGRSEDKIRKRQTIAKRNTMEQTVERLIKRPRVKFVLGGKGGKDNGGGSGGDGVELSAEVAAVMAGAVREQLGADIGLGVTGVAGPGGGTPDKPVGTVHIAVAGPRATLHRTLHLSGSRRRIQSLAVGGVLDLLRRQLQGL